MSADKLKDTISGTIENVVYHNESNDYTVLEISDKDEKLITAVGIIPFAFEGESVVLTGSWSYHKEFGKQFAFDSFEKSLPEHTDGILQYLSSRTVKGVGPVTALRIVQRFGTDTFDVIENHPEWLADLPGITLKKAAVIAESFREQTGIRGVMMFCRDFMGTGEVTKVYKRLGAGAVGIIKENPYILCEDDFGISFEKADAIAMSLGQAQDSPERILSGIKYILSYNASTNGHTCLPTEKLLASVSQILGVSEQKIYEELVKFLADGKLSKYKSGENEYISTCEVDEAESAIARNLYRISRDAVKYASDDIAALIEKVEASLGLEFAAMQKKAIFKSLDDGVMILTGGPGTGKTTVIKALISIYRSLGQKTVLAAPTGRAAKRMSEATGEEAKTVHRMLEMERSQTDGIVFGRNAGNPLSEGVVIVDECSMLDLSLAAALLRAVRRGGRLILIGDSDQLPSVGAGNVLSDLLATERINTVRLNEIFRQSKQSLIITNAHRINNGERPLLGVTDNDFFFVKRDREGDIVDTVADLIIERLPKTYGRSIRDKIQVISPSRKGSAGVDNLNAALQERLNPASKFKREKQSHGVVFREGDKVMQVINDYEIEWDKNGQRGVGLFNGDIGEIRMIDLKNENVVCLFDDKMAEYSFDMLEELELAYAITIHKSQGSEYPVIIIPMYSCPPMLMTRNLLYTAVTRARTMVILVGRADIAVRMVENKREILRYTTLAEKIKDYY